MKASEILERHRPDIIKIVKKYEAKGFHNPRVFGSVARGDDTDESDIDLMVDIKSGFRPSLLTLIAMNNDLEELLGVKVDLITARSIPEDTREKVFKEAIAL